MVAEQRRLRSPTASCGFPPNLPLLGIGTAWLGRTSPESLSHPVCAFRGFLCSCLNGKDVWLVACATRWIKSSLYSYFQNRFQGKQHLILLWNSECTRCFQTQESVKPPSRPESRITVSSSFQRGGA